MRDLALLFVLLTAVAPLKPVRNADLTLALNYQNELASSYDRRDAAYNVRVYEVATFIGECGGTVRSCPDVDLYIAVSESDLGAEPALYRLPRAKGFEFVGWLASCPPRGDDPMMGVLVRTTLPEANIDETERGKWVSTEYQVCVSPRAATFSAEQHNHGVQRTGTAPLNMAPRSYSPLRGPVR